MEELNYTVITVSTKEVKHICGGVCFDDRQSAERYAEGLMAGLSLAGKNYGVILMLNGEYNPHTAITKNMSYKHVQAFYSGYVWPREETATAI